MWYGHCGTYPSRSCSSSFLAIPTYLNQVPDTIWIQIPLRGLKILQKWTKKIPVFGPKQVAEVGISLPPLRGFLPLPKTSSGFGWYPTTFEEKNCKIVFEGLLEGSLTIDNDNLCLRDDLLPYLCGTFGFETLPC